MNLSENQEIVKYETFLFDWDGCLAKTLQNWLDTYKFVYQKYGVYTNDQDILTHSWGNLQKGPEYFGIKNFEEAWREIVSVVAERNKNVALYNNAFQLLTELVKANKRVAIVTSSEMKIVRPAIEFNNLEKIVANIFTEEMVSKPKPDPEIVKLAIEKLHARSESTVIIGDTAKDILAGKAAHIKTVLVSHSENGLFYDLNKMRECGPDYEVSGL